MTLLPTTVGVTLLLTLAALFVFLSELGAGALLYVAMLGDAAVWMVPGPLAQAIPAGLLGGILIAIAGQLAANAMPRDDQRQRSGPVRRHRHSLAGITFIAGTDCSKP